MALKPDVFLPFRSVIAAESTRHGGVSSPPFETLNLGLSSGDEQGRVMENRQRFFGSLGIGLDELVLSHQVHGDKIYVAEKSENIEGFDALITHRKNLFLAVSVADCTPVLIYDSRQQAVAAIHAGWRGTAAGIVFKTLGKLMDTFGTTPADCMAYIGTCIDECAFEVGEDVAEQFQAAHKHFDQSTQKFLIDLKAANRSQLEDAGVPHANIEVSPRSSFDADFFSYRKSQGRTGRMMAVIGLRENETRK